MITPPPLTPDLSSWRVTYLEKDGRTPARPVVFGSRAPAETFAAAVHGHLEPVTDIDVAPGPTIKRCPPADRELVEATTRAYYERHWARPKTPPRVISAARAAQEVLSARSPSALGQLSHVWPNKERAA